MQVAVVIFCYLY